MRRDLGLRGGATTVATLTTCLDLQLLVGFRLAGGGALTTAALAGTGRQCGACMGDEGGGGSIHSGIRLLHLFHEEHVVDIEEQE
jgi:hypothetical protein